MNNLIAFDSIYLQKFALAADLVLDQRDPSLFELIFQWRDELQEVDRALGDYHYAVDEILRQDELWKSTCFELFLNPVGHKRYFEFNFSPESHAWNCYQFAGYRFPQPPTPDNEFAVLNWRGHANALHVQIKNNSHFSDFNVGLTAVIKNKKNQITYFALRHEGGKPDFHAGETFILKRGLNAIPIGS